MDFKRGELGRVFHGDCVAWMQELAADSVDAVVTDPPYLIGIMGQTWDTYGDRRRWHAQWLREAVRCLKPGGHLVAFSAARTWHHLASAAEEQGLEVRDLLAWAYGSGWPKGRRLPGGWHSTLKPGLEPILLARKGLDGSLEQNLGRWGVGGLRVEACRIPWATDTDQAEAQGKNKHASYGTAPLTGNTMYGDFSQVARKDYQAPGRWPSTLLLSHTAHCVDRGGAAGWACTRACEIRQLDAQGWNQQAGAGAARFFAGFPHATGPEQVSYVPKAGKDEKGAGNKHLTVKPIALMRYLCRLVCPPGGVILDPFCGSGTTILAAVEEGSRAVGIELDAQHCEIARGRLRGAEMRIRLAETAQGTGEDCGSSEAEP